MLDILELQTDPKPLCNMIVKILTQDDISSWPLHTGLLLDYVMQWSSGRSTEDRKFSKKCKHLLKKGLLRALGVFKCNFVFGVYLFLVLQFSFIVDLRSVTFY